MAKVNMNLVTEVQPIQRRDFEPETLGLINPHNTPGSAADPLYLLDGEFLTLNGEYKLNREGPGSAGSGVAVTGGALLNPVGADTAAKVPCYPIWAERGRWDVQAIRKVPVFFIGPFEADFHEDILAGGDTFKVGDKLYVNWLSDGTDRNRRRGLTKVMGTNSGADLAVPHAVVTRVHSSGLYKVRALVVVPSL
jgi:hypothetical protein